MEELEPKLQAETSTTTETITEPVVEKTRLTDLPSLEDFYKSEQEVDTSTPEIKGLKRVEPNLATENMTFKRKEDEKKTFLKKRLKLVTAVYIGVLTLLLGFVCINIATLAILNRDINSNTATIQAESGKVEIYENNAIDPEAPLGTIEISLNEPRDYGDDKKELTFLDKVTILFRNIFG